MSKFFPAPPASSFPRFFSFPQHPSFQHSQSRLRPLFKGGRPYILQEWLQQPDPEQHAFASSLSSSINLRYAPPYEQLQLSDDDLNGVLTDLAWDQAANFHLDPISGDLQGFPTSDLELDYSACLDTQTPLLDYFQSLPSDSASLPTTSSLTNTPATTTIQSPSPAAVSPDSPALVPGLKLPQPRRSKPGRRPAASTTPSSRVSDGRVSKPSAAEVDHDVILRRQRNNLAAQRYRQKKIDRIQELEDEVKQVKEERDELRIRLARQEAEVAALREMLDLRKGSGEGSKSPTQSVSS